MALKLIEITTPAEWYRQTIGRKYDVDNFPKSNRFQCWDYFAFFCLCGKLNVNTYCNRTGYAGDLWLERYNKGYSKYFDFLTDIKQAKDGDWLFYPRHVAIYYQGREVGQNQNRNNPAVCSIPLNRNILGIMRFKYWNQPKGVAEIYSRGLAGIYKTDAPLNIRTGGNTSFPSLAVLPAGTSFRCYGYAHNDNGRTWLYGLAYPEGKSLTGFCCLDYLTKEKT